MSSDFMGVPFFTNSEKREIGRAKAWKNRKGRTTIPHLVLHGKEHKSCARCCRLKPLEEFSKSSTLDRLDSRCKDCRKEAERERAKNKKAVEVSK